MRGDLDRHQPVLPSSRASPANSAVLPPGPAHRSSHGPAGASARVRPQATSCDPSSCTPARPSRTAGRSAGLPGPAGGERRVPPGSAPASASSVTSASPGRTASVTGGLTLSASSAGPQLVGRQHVGVRVDDPPRVGGLQAPAGRRSSSPAASRSSQLVEVAFGDPAQDGVDEPDDPLPDRGRRQVDGGRHGGPGRDPHRQDLVGCRAGAGRRTAGCRLCELASARGGDDQVVACPGRGRSRRAARWRRRRRGRRGPARSAAPAGRGSRTPRRR